MSEPSPRPPTPAGLPLLGNTAAFAREPLAFIRRSVESTGDVFRMRLLGREVTVLAHPDHLETALRDRETFAKLGDFEVAFGEALLAVEGEQWRRQRRAMEGFFSPSRVGEYAEAMAAVADDRAASWTAGETVRLDEEMRVVALANLFEVVLGESLTDEEIADLTDAAAALNGWFEPTSWALPDWVPTPARYRFRRGTERLRDHARGLLADAADGTDEDSLLARLAALRADPDSAFDESEVLDQVVGMLFAGHETTALAMTYALHQVGAHPAVAERVRAELADVSDPPSFADLQALDALDRVVDEALRLYPPVHGIPRVTTDAVEVGGYDVPAGQQALLAVWSVHRDPRFYDDPLAFDPGRWRDASPADRGYAFVPFGAGPRVCIGRHFARLEMKAVLATVCRRYDLAPAAPISVSPQMTSQPDGHVPVTVTERE